MIIPYRNLPIGSAKWVPDERRFFPISVFEARSRVDSAGVRVAREVARWGPGETETYNHNHNHNSTRSIPL